MRLIVGISGASGVVYGVEFLKRCPAEEKYVILTRWGRNLLRTEAGLTPEHLSPFVKKVYATEDLSAPFASGSNPFDALVIMPCSVATLGKIANGISDTLLTRTAEVALKERRKLILAIRETPLSSIALENALKLSREGVVIMPIAPPFYTQPRTLEDLVISFVDKAIGTLGLTTAAAGWRASELE
ncbi:MAG: UbiX family flavin prenyltransferase [Elusimicrobiota bacterium]|jgi:4-hydroxy-3-polyprenylbenzoate decarboxylase